MAAARFKMMMFKSMQSSMPQTMTVSTRQFAAARPSKTKPKAKAKTAKKPKGKKVAVVKPPRVTKAVQRLLKQYPDPSAPKRPATSYIRFCADYRNNHKMETLSPDTMSKNSKMMASAWRLLDKSQKDKYIHASERDSKHYKAEQKKYQDGNKQAAWLEKIKRLSKTRPPQTGYQYFMHICLPKLKVTQPNIAHKEAFACAAKEWKSLSAEQKLTWNKTAKAKLEDWQKQIK